ncbi:hypothetical protein BDN70DRAFT_874447 [Pholiota conissans]|uniref:Uncharacterized protein n=1 Tax=Pholiota conissans TaxID=109636 RepID=A0A9P6D3V4_9AGAR|nr:hypothetical protein BDN70DRAFT_874447 [Pholiota conissans]
MRFAKRVLTRRDIWIIGVSSVLPTRALATTRGTKSSTASCATSLADLSRKHPRKHFRLNSASTDQVMTTM